MQQIRFSGSSRVCTASGGAANRAVGSSRTTGANGSSSSSTTVTSTPIQQAVTCGEATTVSSKRRQLVQTATAAAVAALLPLPAVAATAAGDWSSPGLAAPEDEALPKFFKTANGVWVQELTVGKGPQAQQGDAVLIDYVLRRANGYFIYGTIEGVSFQPKDVPVGPVKLQLGTGDVIEGLETVLVGMRQGSKRRVLVPPEAGYVSSVLQPQMPTFATKRQLANHSSEPLLFEVELLRVLPS